ncbi:MAG: hypothetical protein R3F39_16980 [Myxococcota bacterium]
MHPRRLAPCLLAIAALALACESSGTSAPAAPDAAATADTPAPPAATSRLAVIDRLAFARVETTGVSYGFDLDDRVSDASDPAGCFQADFVSPSGATGIDNNFGSLFPFFAAAGIGAAEVLLQSTIEEGGILLMFQLDGVDDPLNDEQVALTVRTGLGKPLIATDGLILPGQTFHLRPDSPDSTTQTGRIVDGLLTAGPMDTVLRVQVLGDIYEMPIYGATIRARVTEDGGLADGVIGTGIAIADLLKVGESNSDVLNAMVLLFDATGDLAPDANGVCQQVSAAILFNAVSAYLYDEVAAP